MSNSSLGTPSGQRMEDAWTFWREDYNKATNLTNLDMVTTVSTAAEFWAAFNTGDRVTIGQLSTGQGVQIFRRGIKPVMDDPANQQGGHFSIIVREGSVRKRAEMWLTLATELILNTNVEKVPFVREVNGIGLSQCESSTGQHGTYTEVKVWLRGGFGVRNNAEGRKDRKKRLQELVKTPTTWCDHKGQQQHGGHTISVSDDLSKYAVGQVGGNGTHSRGPSSEGELNSTQQSNMLSHDRRQSGLSGYTTIVAGVSSPVAPAQANPTHAPTQSNGSLFSNELAGSYRGHHATHSSCDFDAFALGGGGSPQVQSPVHVPGYPQQAMPQAVHPMGYPPQMVQPAQHQQQQQHPQHPQGRHVKSNTYAGLSPAVVCAQQQPLYSHNAPYLAQRQPPPGYQPLQPVAGQPPCGSPGTPPHPQGLAHPAQMSQMPQAVVQQMQAPQPQAQPQQPVPQQPRQPVQGELRQGFRTRNPGVHGAAEDARSRRMKAMSLSAMSLPSGAALAGLNGGAGYVQQGAQPQQQRRAAYPVPAVVTPLSPPAQAGRCTPESVATPQTAAPTPLTQGSVGYSSSGTVGGSAPQGGQCDRGLDADADDDDAKSEASDDTCIENVDLDEASADDPAQAMVAANPAGKAQRGEVVSWADDFPEDEGRSPKAAQRTEAAPPPYSGAKNFSNKPGGQQQFAAMRPAANQPAAAAPNGRHPGPEAVPPHPVHAPAYTPALYNNSPYDMRSCGDYQIHTSYDPEQAGDYYQ